MNAFHTKLQGQQDSWRRHGVQPEQESPLTKGYLRNMAAGLNPPQPQLSRDKAGRKVLPWSSREKVAKNIRQACLDLHVQFDLSCTRCASQHSLGPTAQPCGAVIL
jgi:hypothetical protein